MSSFTWITFLLLFVGALFIMTISCDTTDADVYDNHKTNNEVSAIKRPSFFVGSRYGRSQFYGSADKGINNLNVVPRNDRFFLGSRYGKRSDEFMQDVVEQDPSRSAHIGRYNLMSCIYTGVKDFYRCYKSLENDDKDQLLYQSTDEI